MVPSNLEGCLEEAMNGTSLRDLPMPGLGGKIAKMPADSV